VTSGFVLGTLSAIAWGSTDLFVTYVSRRIGFFRTVLLSQFLGVCMLVVIAIAIGDLPGASIAQLLALVAVAPMAIVAYGGFYRALELGPIAIVSPIVSANGAVVVVLALLILSESLSAVQAVGCVLVLGSIMLAALEPRAVIEEAGAGSGVRLAIAASLAFGGYLFGMAVLSEDLGWLVPILVTRAVTVAVLATVELAGRVRPVGRVDGRAVLACLAAGLLDASGYLAFNRGAEIGEVALTAAAASAYPVIPIVWGLLALRERVARHQLIGVAGVLTGMVVLSLG
jgi:drug/metabolite transporter (DMT)-like permease